MSTLPVVNVLTDGGAALLASSIAQAKPVIYTIAKLGTGSAGTSDVSELAERTALVTYYDDADIVKKASDSTVLVVSAQYWNTNVSSAVAIKEIGLYAKLQGQADNAAVLFSYLTFGDSQDLIPAYSTTPVQRTYDIPFDFGTGEAVSVTIDPSGLVPASAVSTSATAGAIVQRDSNGKVAGDITGSAYQLGGHTYDWFSPATHTHAAATTSAAGFLSASDKTALNTVTGRVDQALTQSSTPTFAGLVITGGYIDGARFR